MAATVDLDNVVEVNAIGFRALCDALGDDGVRIFIDQFRNNKGQADDWPERPRLTASQIAEVFERGRAWAANIRARTNEGRGNFTADRHNLPGMTLEEAISGIMRLQEQNMPA